jgi:predicted ATP-dependent protease
VPIRQDLAVTGSVDQQGQVQAIGGAVAKIEGFFDICKARSLTGRQGAVIPADNVRHLTLRSDVVEAVRQGQFHIYAVETIDQGIELLTGVAAGATDAEGSYPPDTVNYGVHQRLLEMAEEKTGKDDEDDEDEPDASASKGSSSDWDSADEEEGEDG